MGPGSRGRNEKMAKERLRQMVAMPEALRISLAVHQVRQVLGLGLGLEHSLMVRRERCPETIRHRERKPTPM